MNENIGVVGLGYVGLTFSVVAAEAGYNVYGIEKENHILDCINNGKAHFYEKDIDEKLKRLVNKKLFVGQQIDGSIKYDYFIITVGTPLNDKHEANIDYILQAIDTIGVNYSGEELVILRSTVAVGVTKEYIVKYLSRISGKKEREVNVCFCPERTIEGAALEELKSVPQIIGYNNEISKIKANKLFKNITSECINVESLEAAELVKLFNNTYRDIYFSIGNYFNYIAQSFGIDGVKLINAANKNYQRSNIASPGLVGGPCLEKDAYILTSNLTDQEGKNFVLGARIFNESLETKIENWVNSQTNNNDIVLAVSGIAFKGRPATSDIRGSSAINIIKRLNYKYKNIMLHDYIVPELILRKYGKVENDFMKLVKKSNVILILNNHLEYSKLNFNILQETIKDCKILDVWNNFGDKIDNNNYFTIGNHNMKS